MSTSSGWLIADATARANDLPAAVDHTRTLGDALDAWLRAIKDQRLDPMVVCAPAPLSAVQRRGIEHFIATYATMKQVPHRVRGHQGATDRGGWLRPIG